MGCCRRECKRGKYDFSSIPRFRCLNCFLFFTLSSLVVLFAVVTISLSCHKDDINSFENSEYQTGDEVPLYAVNLGSPEDSIIRTKFYSLGSCKPDAIVDYQHNWVLRLRGHHKLTSAYQINYRVSQNATSLCESTYCAGKTQRYADAIDNNYYFDFQINGISVQVPIGFSNVDNNGFQVYYLYTNLDFQMAAVQNGNQIAGASATPSNPIQLQLGVDNTISFTYSVSWVDATASVVADR